MYKKAKWKTGGRNVSDRKAKLLPGRSHLTASILFLLQMKNSVFLLQPEFIIRKSWDLPGVVWPNEYHLTWTSVLIQKKENPIDFQIILFSNVLLPPSPKHANIDIMVKLGLLHVRSNLGGSREFSGVAEILYILLSEVVTWVDTAVETHWKQQI